MNSKKTAVVANQSKALCNISQLKAIWHTLGPRFKSLLRIMISIAQKLLKQQGTRRHVSLMISKRKTLQYLKIGTKLQVIPILKRRRIDGATNTGIYTPTPCCYPIMVNYTRVINSGHCHISEHAQQLHSRDVPSVRGNISAQSVQPQGEEGRKFWGFKTCVPQVKH